MSRTLIPLPTTVPSGLERLIQDLKACTVLTGYLTALQSAQIAATDLLPHATWNTRHYTRNPIVRTDEFELMLTCFEPGQRTSIHDYDGVEAWVHPVEGGLLEERYVLDAQGDVHLSASTLIGQGSYSHLIQAHSIHRYINRSEGRTLSLHLYAPPLRKWRMYDERTGGSYFTTPPGAAAAH